jgi:hypothetical protein
MDWMTLTIEAIGFVILCIWIVVPIREFRLIFHRLNSKPAKNSVKPAEVAK